jgi:hypothetical protein
MRCPPECRLRSDPLNPCILAPRRALPLICVRLSFRFRGPVSLPSGHQCPYTGRGARAPQVVLMIPLSHLQIGLLSSQIGWII